MSLFDASLLRINQKRALYRPRGKPRIQKKLFRNWNPKLGFDPAIKEIATSMLDRVSPGILQMLAQESGGNPLYAIEYARLLREEKENPVPKAEESRGLMKPRSVYDVILRRLSRLKPENVV
jgi:hypothetical protein